MDITQAEKTLTRVLNHKHAGNVDKFYNEDCKHNKMGLSLSLETCPKPSHVVVVKELEPSSNKIYIKLPKDMKAENI